MLATYQNPKAIYGQVQYATPQVVQQPQIYQTPSVIGVPPVQMQRPVSMSQLPGPSMMSEFPFTSMQATGGLIIALSLIVIGLGIAGAVIDPMTISGTLGSFGLSSVLSTALLGIATGVIGIYQRQGSGNLEAYRNAYMVMGAVLAIHCMFIIGIETWLVVAVNVAVEASGGAPGFEIYNGIYIALIAVTALVGLMGLIASSIGCCCAPQCCSPLVTQGEYSYVYTKDTGFMPMGYGPRPQMY